MLMDPRYDAMANFAIALGGSGARPAQAAGSSFGSRPASSEHRSRRLPTSAPPRSPARTPPRHPALTPSWGERDRFYRDKYRGTVWQLITLASLGADGADPRIRAGCEAVLRDAQDPRSGGFAYDRAASIGGGQHSAVIPCLTGNLVWVLVTVGLLDDERVQRGIDWITGYQRFDTGDGPAPTGWPYQREPCWGRHTCHMGAVKSLKALATVPRERWTPPIERTVAGGVEYLLRHHVHKRCHDPSEVSRPGWTRLGFPLMYQDDVLEVLRVLTALGVRDPRMREATDLVVAKADDAGRLRLEQTFNDRFRVRVESKGRPSRWLTLEALRMLKAA